MTHAPWMQTTFSTFGAGSSLTSSSVIWFNALWFQRACLRKLSGRVCASVAVRLHVRLRNESRNVVVPRGQIPVQAPAVSGASRAEEIFLRASVRINPASADPPQPARKMAPTQLKLLVVVAEGRPQCLLQTRTDRAAYFIDFLIFSKTVQVSGVSVEVQRQGPALTLYLHRDTTSR